MRAWDAPAPVATADAASQRVDIRVGELVTVRLVGAGAADRSAVERQFGVGGPATQHPADITVHYRDEVGRTPDTLRYVGPGAAGFTRDDLVLLRGRFRKPVRMRFPAEQLGGAIELCCEHGVGRVPHLVALVNLAVLRRGGLALHASAFEQHGAATVATGWAKGGKTEALLAACDGGAPYVADEWTYLAPDGTATGSWEPVRVWDWQLAQLPWLRQRVGAASRARLAALGAAEQLAERGRSSTRATTAIGRTRHVDLPPETVARNGRRTVPTPVGRVLLMTSTDAPRTWVQPLSGREVADRMAASLAYERLPLAEVVAAHRYAFPHADTSGFDQAYELERTRLHELLDHLPAAEVLHPHPVDLAELGAAIAVAAEELR